MGQHPKNKDVTTETPPNVLVVTFLDTSEPSSEMLISTWLASTVLNSGIHTKTKCYGITLQISVLNPRKNGK